MRFIRESSDTCAQWHNGTTVNKQNFMTEKPTRLNINFKVDSILNDRGISYEEKVATVGTLFKDAAEQAIRARLDKREQNRKKISAIFV